MNGTADLQEGDPKRIELRIPTARCRYIFEKASGCAAVPPQTPTREWVPVHPEVAVLGADPVAVRVQSYPARDLGVPSSGGQQNAPGAPEW